MMIFLYQMHVPGYGMRSSKTSHAVLYEYEIYPNNHSLRQSKDANVNIRDIWLWSWSKEPCIINGAGAGTCREIQMDLEQWYK